MSVNENILIDSKRNKAVLECFVSNVQLQYKIEDLADSVNPSKFHFKCVFKKLAGISLQKFLKSITLNNLKKGIQSESSVQKLFERIGLSTQSRGHDIFMNIEAVTPYGYKNKRININKEYGIHNTPYGKCFITNTTWAICGLDFRTIEKGNVLVITNFMEKWKNTRVTNNHEETKKLIQTVSFGEPALIKALLYAIAFQIKVWETLLMIPLDKLAYIQPCHWVISTTGEIGQYNWGGIRTTVLMGRGNHKKTENNPKIQYPIVHYITPKDITEAIIDQSIATRKNLPMEFEKVLGNLSKGELSNVYGSIGWNGVPIINHSPYSRLKGYCSFKPRLTEPDPGTKPYIEERWAALFEPKTEDIEGFLSILKNLKKGWKILLAAISKTYETATIFKKIKLKAPICVFGRYFRHHMQYSKLLKYE